MSFLGFGLVVQNVLKTNFKLNSVSHSGVTQMSNKSELNQALFACLWDGKFKRVFKAEKILSSGTCHLGNRNWNIFSSSSPPEFVTLQIESIKWLLQMQPTWKWCSIKYLTIWNVFTRGKSLIEKCRGSGAHSMRTRETCRWSPRRFIWLHNEICSSIEIKKITTGR